MTTSWKTSFFGILASIGTAIIGAYQTTPQLMTGLPSWVQGLGVILGAVGMAGFGLAARDNSVTSEQAGAAPLPTPKSGFVPVKILGAVLAFGILAGATGGLTGCASSPARQAYNTVEVTQTTVETAAHVWDDWVSAHEVAISTQKQVRDAFLKYQAAALIAADAARAFADAASSKNSISAETVKQLTSQNAQNALADLLGLMRGLGVKI